MCGVVALLRCRGGLSLRGPLQTMTGALAHRGPDGEGTWCDDPAGVALGHRRLAIADTSAMGAQPMVSSSGRYVVTYNGEAYNSPDLRCRLSARGHVFRGGSDTETILAGFDEWGIRETLVRLNGMFAIVVWDRGSEVLGLARDRVGQKPLHIADCGFGFVVASELKALELAPQRSRSVDRSALRAYLRLGYIPAPYTIFERTSKVAPGELVWLSRERGRRSERYLGRAYAVASPPRELPERESVDEVERQLVLSVEDRLFGDHPVGVFLSGGIDSALVAAVAQSLQSAPVQAFTVGFHEQPFDEAPFAKAIADRLGLVFNHIYFSEADAAELVGRLPRVFDEPFADSSQLPTLALSCLASESVKVVMTGDGGDELFCGYKRYRVARRLFLILDSQPQELRSLLGWLLASVPPDRWDAVIRGVPFLARKLGDRGVAGSKLHRLSAILRSYSRSRAYRMLLSHWHAPEQVARDSGVTEARSALDMTELDGAGDLIRAMGAIDFASYLPDDLLVKVDRCSMAVGLEARSPFLDPRMLRASVELQSKWKLRKGVSKWILHQVLERYLPRSFFDRPKMGFGIPLAAWLRGALRPWAEDLLANATLRRQGYLEPEVVATHWNEHLNGVRDRQDTLWSVLMFQAWLHEREASGCG